MFDRKTRHNVSCTAMDFSSQDADADAAVANLGRLRSTHGLRAALTLVGLCASIMVSGMSAKTLSVYHATYEPAEYLQPLWPDDLDLRPTYAFIVGGVIITIASAISVLADRMSFVRKSLLLRTPLLVLAPLAALVASLTVMAFFYGVGVSDKADTVQSWSCRWEDRFMTARPHFGTLCRQSLAALYLAALLVPIEAAILTLTAYQAVLERNVRVHTPIAVGKVEPR
ncbi:hypothetical protein SODALDRAFT_330049 [Sodiomyces alkalinus F11]|uniref:Uncharacterized protein n=1 Tax=Sodiomyces alkalinus (strain CBS 110278 / VKM F-3762 / F11) TaxID=1314773 RepID=A0A3N2Q0X3_SODAK|nr:hypothetical protein SODALDRAFT_330049 [Sodiomyces alkalinus F11]ROT40338.1 hypothetical protein SODALDRAFT_330049 [Sodiomyces alkalinus F11]